MTNQDSFGIVPVRNFFKKKLYTCKDCKEFFFIEPSILNKIFPIKCPNCGTKNVVIDKKRNKFRELIDS